MKNETNITNIETVINYLQSEVDELKAIIANPKWESTASLNHKKGQLEAYTKSILVLQNKAALDLYTL